MTLAEALSRPNTKPAIWSPDRVADLKRYWAEGQSIPFMVKRLRLGAWAINAEAERQGLPKRSAESVNEARRIANTMNARGLRAPPVARAVGQNAGLSFKTKKIVAGNGAVMDATVDSKDLGVAFRCIPATAATLVDLDHGHCKMPVGDLMAFNGADQLFCGAKTRRDKLSPTGARLFQTYCPKHLGEAHKLLPGKIKPTERQIVRELRRHL